jgi:hypothetical protein
MKKKTLTVALSWVLTLALTLSSTVFILPAATQTAHAETSYSEYWKGSYDWSGYELWEDCDWDGYDDHTGKKVPVGFDGTRGDNPNGPGANSQVAKKAQGESYDFGGSESETEKNSVKKKTAKKETKKTSSDSKSDSGDSDSKSKKDKTDNDKEEQEVTETAIAKEIIGSGEVKFEAAENASGGAAEFQPGGSFTIKAEGLKPNVEGIIIELHSDPISLGKISTDANGALSKTIKIPKTAPVGKHNIVLIYDGEELLSQPVTLAAPAAASVSAEPATDLIADADSAAPSTNYGLEFIVGIALLLALLALSVVALLATGIYRRGRRHSPQP